MGDLLLLQLSVAGRAFGRVLILVGKPKNESASRMRIILCIEFRPVSCPVRTWRIICATQVLYEGISTFPLSR
jgi:hypothetical protein